MRMIIALALLAPVIASAAPIQVQHQARLLDGNGVPINGAVVLTVGIYADGSTATAEWVEDISAPAENGYVSLILGADASGNPLDDSVFDGTARYVGVSVGVTALGPRQLVGTVPQAVHATHVAGGTAEVTSAHVSGSLRLGTDSATCPDGATAGEIKWSIAASALLVCDGVDWRRISTDAPSSCAAARIQTPTAPTGVYSLAPGGGTTLEVWCDMGTTPPRALLMRISGTSSGHAQNNARAGAYPCTPSAAECKLSSTEISRFIQEVDTQVFEVDPQGGGYLSFFQRASSDSQAWPVNLEGSNRSALAASGAWSWILTSYQTYGNALNNLAPDVGDYASANHYYPTPYADQQFFFRGNETGIRANTAWSPSGYSDNLNGYLWVY